MATYKRIDGDYRITTVNSADTVTVETHTMEVVGNLNVRGNITYIETSELKVDDPFITVAANNTGSGNTALFPDQGLVAQTGTASFAGLRFNNDTSEWQISPSVTADGSPITAYQTIGTAAAGSPGGSTADIQFNAGGNTFGGNAAFQYDAANTRVQLQGPLLLGNIGTAPTAVANQVAVYHNQESFGGSGLFVKSATVEDELVSRARAIAFSLIL